ncbi:MAG TPA: hypothetical protein VL866_20090, partial [Pyrinomonadaceae bacterium]|nr:hypothetical protein [Pyrinomonadaceae bacterium]
TLRHGLFHNLSFTPTFRLGISGSPLPKLNKLRRATTILMVFLGPQGSFKTIEMVLLPKLDAHPKTTIETPT